MAGKTLGLTGSGSGYGYGYGDGSGDGSGYGYGYGYGDGSGDGYGYGDGSGDGYGDGYGYGDKKTNARYFGSLLGRFQSKKPARSKLFFWRSNSDGTPANGGHSTTARPGLTEAVEGPLNLCTSGALHGSMNPAAWKGDRWWVVALHQPIVTDGDKSGSLKRTFVADLGRCPL